MIARTLLIAQCQSMSLLLNARIGDVNPWSGVKFDDYDDAELVIIKKMMHELLYSPPPKS